jgi:hypothetical protein
LLCTPRADSHDRGLLSRLPITWWHILHGHGKADKGTPLVAPEMNAVYYKGLVETFKEAGVRGYLNLTNSMITAARSNVEDLCPKGLDLWFTDFSCSSPSVV